MFTAERSLRREERRSGPRLLGPLPCLIRGVDTGGEAFEAETELDDMTASGLRLRLRRRVQTGATIFIVARLTRSRRPGGRAARVALLCAVLRCEPCPDGTYSADAATLRHRFLEPEG